MVTINWRELVQIVKEKTDIVDLISQTVELRRNGLLYIGLCPFPHGWQDGKPVYDTKPSLVVYPGNSSYYCYGCGAGNSEAVHGGGSDVIGWIQNIHDVDFKEAVRILADRLGLQYNEITMQSDNISAWEQTDNIDKLYRDTLWANKDALNYLKKRGLTKEAIEHGRLGFVSNSKYPSLNGRISIGICAPPLKDGRILTAGFAYRATDDSIPKYLLGQNTPSFSRRNHLYLFYRNLKDIRAVKHVVLTEGYFDALSLWNKGVKNTCAIMGTMITDEQVNLLRRYTSKVVLWLDGDTGGHTSLLRTILQLYTAKMSLKVVDVNGLDPDEFARIYDGDLNEFIKHKSQPAWEWLLTYAIQEKLNSSFTTWSKTSENIRKVITLIPDQAVSSSVMKEFNKICG